MPTKNNFRLQEAFFTLREWLSQVGVKFSYKKTGHGGLCHIDYTTSPPRPYKIQIDPGYKSWEQKIVILAHEAGHVVDLAKEPLDVKEILVITNSNLWKANPWTYWRETKAWVEAMALLKELEVYKLVRRRFIYIREVSLSSYNKSYRAYIKKKYK